MTALIIFGWVTALSLAYVLWETRRAPIVPNEPEQDPFEEVDAVVFQFPERRPGGGWVA